MTPKLHPNFLKFHFCCSFNKILIILVTGRYTFFVMLFVLYNHALLYLLSEKLTKQSGFVIQSKSVYIDVLAQECGILHWVMINTLRLRQSGCHFADKMFNCIFLNENTCCIWIPIKISLKFVPKALINNIPALVKIMAWRRPGDKPLSEPMVVSLLTHIYVTRPQWVNTIAADWNPNLIGWDTGSTLISKWMWMGDALAHCVARTSAAIVLHTKMHCIYHILANNIRVQYHCKWNQWRPSDCVSMVAMQSVHVGGPRVLAPLFDQPH